MNFDDYQKMAKKTASVDNSRTAIAVWTLGLCGESGEVAEKIKKWLGHGADLDIEAVKGELGDVLWYLSMLAHSLKIDLEDVASANIAKLKARYPNGFVPGGGVR